MADTVYRLVGDIQEATVTSVSYTASTTITVLSAITSRGARRIIYNNGAIKVFINRTGTTTITSTTDSIPLAAAGSYSDTLYMGKVMLFTTSASTSDVRVEEIKYSVY